MTRVNLTGFVTATCVVVGLLLGSAASSTAATLPGGIPDPEFWLTADAVTGLTSGDPVSLWPDSGTGGHDALQADPLKQPLWVDGVLGGKPVVRFDGALTLAENDVLNTPTLQIGSDTTVFMLVKNAPQNLDPASSLHRAILAADNNPYRGDGNGYGLGYRRGNTAGFHVSQGQGTAGTSEQWIAQLSAPTDQFEIVTYLKESTAARLYRDQTVTLAASGTQIDPVGGYHTGYNIGADPSFFQRSYRGDVAELLVFNETLSTSERMTVGNHLKLEYGLLPATDLPVTDGLTLHLDADYVTTDAAGKVESWDNRAQAQYGAFQASGGNRPLAVAGALAGHGVVRFDGAADFLTTPDLPIGTDATVFFVTRNTPQTGGGSIHRGILAWEPNPYQAAGTGYGFGHFRGGADPRFNISLGNGTGEDKFTVPTIMDDEFRIWSFTRDGSATDTAELFENGFQVGGPYAFGRTSGLTPGYNIGSDPGAGRDYKGDVAAVIVYDRELSPEEHNAVGAYLEQKYVMETDFVPGAGLQAYWNFDDGSSATDQVGSHHGIAFNGGANHSTDTPAAGGHSLDLTHGNDYVTLPPSDYGIVDEYTISAWVKRTADGRVFSIKRDLTSGGGDRSGVTLGISGTELFSGVISSGPNNAANGGQTFHDIKTADGVDVPAAEWIHVLATLKDDVVTMYVDGVAATSYTGDNGTGTGQLKVLDTDIDFLDDDGSFSGFGADGYANDTSVPDYATGYYHGLLDEVAVWNAALPIGSIQALAGGALPTSVPVPEPSSLWLLSIGLLGLLVRGGRRRDG